MDVAAVLKNSAGTGEIVHMTYNGGSRPGEVGVRHTDMPATWRAFTARSGSIMAMSFQL